MYIACQYNGKDLYSNHWELCTVEEGMPDRVIYCPIAPGKHKFVKDLDIPNYLPKVRDPSQHGREISQNFSKLKVSKYPKTVSYEVLGSFLTL